MNEEINENIVESLMREAVEKKAGLDALLLQSFRFLESNLGIKPNQSTYKKHSQKEWQIFCSEQNLDRNSFGVYFPRNLSAHILSGTSVLPVIFFHELFGHGTFCEHSSYGRRICALEKEIQETGDEAVRHELFTYMKKHIGRYEGFAFWVDYYMAREFGLLNLWNRRNEHIDSYFISLALETQKTAEKEGFGKIREIFGFE